MTGVMLMVLPDGGMEVVGLNTPSGRASVRFGGMACKVGFIDAAGDLVIPLELDEAGSFSGGLAPARKNGKWGFILPDGTWAMAAQFDEVRRFTEDLAGAKQDGKWGFVDRGGKWAIPARYDEVQWFSEGFAAVKIGDRWHYIDKAGKRLGAGPNPK